MPDLVISMVDYQNVPVSCEREKWETKILRDHPELEGREELMLQAISDPLVVLQDREYGNRKHHLRESADDLYTDVIVEYSFTKDGVSGRVLTAFVRRRPRAGDILLYMRRLERT